MRYRVRGINLETGLETVVVVEAKHHEAAEAVARRQMTVYEVTPEGGLMEPGDFEWKPPEQRDELASAVAQKASGEVKRPAPRRRPSASAVAIGITLLIVAAAAASIFWWTHR